MSTNKGNKTDNRFGGKMVTHNGMTMNIGDWARYYGRRPSSLTCLAKDCGSIKKAIEKYDSGLKKRTAVEYTYTGETFISITGAVITAGITATLPKWKDICGIHNSTLSSRINRTIADPQTAFNLAITMPIIAKGKRCKKPYEDIASRTAMMLAGAKSKRESREYSDFSAKEKVSTMDILLCRHNHPERRCSPCYQRVMCYGR